MVKNKSEQKEEFEELEELFTKIENLKGFKEWFGKPCPEFQPLCANCDFWNTWQRFKQDRFKEIFQ